ncbi:Rap1a/Tai family immunity protein [Hydrocarboniphaga sp.]|uniref:Rap1a/Tai family immunity protein n=1 Tax=Hydrocarboniphaga sp. TaxID=2033016 RepID=UPI0026346F0F|nr:Rap1a/Tai family immunity protein [Hydrocarboniphaga sp.]
MKFSIRQKISAALLLAAAANPASAFTGTELDAYCNAKGAQEKGLCTGLINGTINSYLLASRMTGFRLMSSIARNAGKSAEEAEQIANSTLQSPEMFIMFNGYCPQDGLSQAQINQVVIKYLHDNPLELTKPAELVIMNAMFTAYPMQGCTWKPKAEPPK